MRSRRGWVRPPVQHRKHDRYRTGQNVIRPRVCTPEDHEAFVVGALFGGGYRPFETILLGGMAEAAAEWRWGVTGPEGRDGFETGAAGGIMASGDCVAGLQVHLHDVAIFIRGDFDDRAL